MMKKLSYEEQRAGNMDKRKKLMLIIKACVLIVFAAGLTAVAVKYSSYIINLVSDPVMLKMMLSSYGGVSIAIYIGIAVIQVIIAALPGELVEVAGGYIYGVIPGSFYSIVGITIGAVIVFYVSRVFGHPFIKLFVPKKVFEKFEFLLNNPKAEVAMFILFLLPGIPKDILTYIAGLTPVRPVAFFLLSTLGRLPSLFVTCFIGAYIQQGNYTAVTVISVITCILVAAGFLMKDRVMKLLNEVLYKKEPKAAVESNLLK